MFIKTDCDKYWKYDERMALKYAGVGKRFLGCSLDNYAPITADQTKALKTIKEYTSENLLTGGRHGQGATHCGTGGHW